MENESPALAAFRELLAEKNRLLEGAAKIDAAISEASPKLEPSSSVTTSTASGDLVTTFASEPPKPGVRSSEMWLAALLPLIVGAVVQLGWLSEEAATSLGMVGGGSYVLGRSLVKSAMEWRKR